MTKQAQIEEITRILHFCEEVPGADCDKAVNCSTCQAQRIHKAGYHKRTKGEWIDKPTGAYGRIQSWCSVCGQKNGIEERAQYRHTPFCPQCGAKMKGD